jgi:flavin reductase (DIM6/NTAB) family NADH-FMN oxidoreductase RutF
MQENLTAKFRSQSFAPNQIPVTNQATSMSGAPAATGFVDKHPDFKKIEQGRPDLSTDLHPVNVTKSPNPDWEWGSGVKRSDDFSHVDIDPYAEGRPGMDNYRLLISGIVPRPIGLLSTRSGDNKTENLSPMSYFQVVDHDPATFVVGFSSRADRPKDTWRNLLESGECVINIVSEDMVEAVMATSVDAPYGVSEWEISGLTRGETKTVKPARVKESVFSIEGKLVDSKEFNHHTKPGFSIASLAIIEAKWFWIRSDALDETKNHIDLNVLKPIAQLGGIAYARVTETFERPRKTWAEAVKEAPWLADLPNAK